MKINKYSTKIENIVKYRIDIVEEITENSKRVTIYVNDYEYTSTHFHIQVKEYTEKEIIEDIVKDLLVDICATNCTNYSIFDDDECYSIEALMEKIRVSNIKVQEIIIKELTRKIRGEKLEYEWETKNILK